MSLYCKWLAKDPEPDGGFLYPAQKYYSGVLITSTLYPRINQACFKAFLIFLSTLVPTKSH